MKVVTAMYSLGLAMVQCRPPMQSEPPKECGRMYLRGSRIVGDKVVNYDHQPWNVALLTTLGPDDKVNVCGGSLISEEFVLTEASCVHKVPTKFITARIGDYEATGAPQEYKPEFHKIWRKIVHENYSHPTKTGDDIALLKLSAPVVFKKHIAPVCLPEKDADFIGENATVTRVEFTHHAWSLASSSSESVRVQRDEFCAKRFLYIDGGGLPNGLLCVPLRRRYVTRPLGPMTLTRDGRSQVIGIPSDRPVCFGRSCLASYTKISNHVDWIKTKIKPDYDHDNPRIQRLFDTYEQDLFVAIIGFLLAFAFVVILVCSHDATASSPNNDNNNYYA